MDHPLELTAESLWFEVSGRLQGALNETTYRTWFAQVAGAELSDDAFVLAVPNDFTREWIEGHFLGLIRAIASDSTGHERRVQLTVESQGPRDPVETAAPLRRGRTPDTARNAKYTFDLFVIGSSNRFAHAAALAVAEAPAQAYNPLFIYGGTGLGKTHLMQAIAQYVTEHSNHASVRYVTSETFMNDFINSLRDKRIEGFKQRYRTYDLLLIDDIQFFEHKERIQEEFFHTFNTLFDGHKQIVLSSDRPPSEINGLEQRLVSRFDWGLTAELQPPDAETRVAILRKKAATMEVRLPDEVIEFIAERVRTNVRRLEGALTRVASYASLHGGKAPLVERMEQLLKDLLQEEARRSINVDQIQKRVAEHFDIRIADMTSKRRPANIAFPRQIAMFLTRELTKLSLCEIGEAFGGRDHGTVLHAHRLVKERSVKDEKTRQAVRFLEGQLTR